MYRMLESTTISMGDLETNNRVEGTELTIDSSTEDGPSPTGALLTSYASCYTIALRIGAQQRDVDDLGEVVIDAEADRDTENDLEAIRFDIAVEAAVDDEILDAIVHRANDLCHVADALREGLQADVSIQGDAR
jgi:uncharacterized OsmC-like protein